MKKSEQVSAQLLWKQFEQTGKISDYLNYCAQQYETIEEGTEEYAGDSKRTGDPRKGSEQR